MENGCSDKEHACKYAVGNLECLQYAREVQHCPWDSDVINASCGFWGSADCFWYCLKNGCPVNDETLSAAIPHLSMLKTLCERGHPCNALALHQAAQQGSIECMGYLRKRNCPGQEELVIHGAKNVRTLHYLHYLGYSFPSEAYKNAARHYSDICVMYLHTHGCPWHTDTCTWFVEANSLLCLQYAHTHGADWCEKTCAAAAEKGYLDILQYAHTQGCAWDARTCANAVAGGHWPCLRYAREHDCPWDERVTAAAAGGGHLMCLKYLHEEGCPWDERTVIAANRTHQRSCLYFALENGCSIGIRQLKRLMTTQSFYLCGISHVPALLTSVLEQLQKRAILRRKKRKMAKKNRKGKKGKRGENGRRKKVRR